MYLPEKKNSLIIVASFLIAVGLSLISLWLLESPLKYRLFIFEVALIFFLCLAYLVHSAWQFSVKVRGVSTFFDYFFFAASLTLLLLIVLNLYSIASQILAIAVCFFLPGYTLLRFIKFRFLHTWVEKLVLSMLLSIPISSLIYTVMLIAVPIGARAVVLASIYILISLSLILWSTFRKSETSETSDIYSADVTETVLLVITLSFVVYAISVTYPQMAYFPGADIAQLFSLDQVVDVAPHLYVLSYPWFQFQSAQVQVLAKQSVGVFQSTITYLTLILVLSFYAMAKAYLKNVDRRIPIFATVFFSLFSGFGWVYFLKEKLVQSDAAMHWPLLAKVNDISYFDLMQGGASSLWLWYRPWTLGLALLMVLLYLLTRQDLSRRKYILLFSISVLTLCFVHFSDLVPFVGILFALTLFNPKIELGLRDGVLATFIGVLAMAVLQIFNGHFLGLNKTAPNNYLIALGAILLISYLLTYFKYRPTLRIGIGAIQLPVLWISLVYIGLLIVWMSSKEPFSASQVVEVSSVPWMLYPVLLGVGGLLSLAGLVSVLKEYRNQPIVVFVYLSLITLVIAKSVDFLNVRFFATGYWESRMVIVIYLALSVLAVVALT